MVTDDQRRVLNAIRPGRDALGTGAGEAELVALFPGAERALRDLQRAGYVDYVTMHLEETGPPSSASRVFHRTAAGEAALTG